MLVPVAPEINNVKACWFLEKLLIISMMSSTWREIIFKYLAVREIMEQRLL